MDEFTCAVCQQRFTKQNDEEWDEKKAKEAYLNLFGESEFVQEEVMIMCEDCGTKYYNWFSALSEEEKQAFLSDPRH